MDNAGPFKQRVGSFYPASLIAVVATMSVVLAFTSSAAAFLLAGVLVLFLAFLQWEPLLYMSVFILPLAPIVQTDFPVHDLVSLLRILIFAGIFGRRLLGHGSIGKWLLGSTLDKLALLYLAIATVSVLVNPVAGTGVRALFRLCSYLALYYTVTAWVQSWPQMYKLAKVLLVSTMLICVLGYYQFITNGYGPWFYWLYHGQEEYIEPFAGRVTSVFLHVNPFAAFINLVLPLALAVQLKSSDDLSLARTGRLCFFMGTLALFLTQSRGAVLAFVFMLWLGFHYLFKDWGTRRKVLLQVVAALLMAVIAWQLQARWMEQQTSSPDASAFDADRFTSLDEATLTRVVIYARAWDLFTSSPVLGIGYGKFSHLFNSSLEGGPDNLWDTHSLYLKLLSETGIVGTLCYLGLIFVVCRLARSGLRGMVSAPGQIVFFAVLAATVTMLVHGFVDVMLDVPQFAGLLWLLFAALMVTQRFGDSTSAVMGNH